MEDKIDLRALMDQTQTKNEKEGLAAMIKMMLNIRWNIALRRSHEKEMRGK